MRKCNDTEFRRLDDLRNGFDLIIKQVLISVPFSSGLNKSATNCNFISICEN